MHGLFSVLSFTIWCKSIHLVRSHNKWEITNDFTRKIIFWGGDACQNVFLVSLKTCRKHFRNLREMFWYFKENMFRMPKRNFIEVYGNLVEGLNEKYMKTWLIHYSCHFPLSFNWASVFYQMSFPWSKLQLFSEHYTAQ